MHDPSFEAGTCATAMSSLIPYFPIKVGYFTTPPCGRDPDLWVIVERKATERSPPVRKRTTLTHVRLAGLRLGLINFGEAFLQDGITRLANGLPDE